MAGYEIDHESTKDRNARIAADKAEATRRAYARIAELRKERA